MLFLSLLIVVFVAGCGTNEEKDVEKNVKEQTLVCTSTENNEDIDVEEVMSMTYQDDKLKHMKLEVNATATNSDLKKNWEEFKKKMNENNPEVNDEGINLKVNVDDKNYKYNIVLDVDVEKVSDEALEKQGFKDLKNDDSTLEETKTSLEKDGATCVIK